MSQWHPWNPAGLEEVASHDAATVVGVLRRSGPLGIGELSRQTDLRAWTAERFERALVRAWEECVISVDDTGALLAL